MSATETVHGDGTILLRGGRVLDPAAGVDEVRDVLIRDGAIAEVAPTIDPDGLDGLDAGGDGTAAGGSRDVEVVDCSGLWVTPGFVDLHTHLREPGFEEAEDVATGSAAGAAGGYTALCAMANTDPVCDAAAVAELVWRRGREVGLVDVFPVGAITKGLAGGELAELGELHRCAARVDFFSDDGKPVADALVMRRALQYAAGLGAVICNHAEDPDLTAEAQMNEGEMSSALGLPGWPHEAEEVMIARDLILAEGVGARLHVPHVTTRGAVELIRLAKARGIAVSAEVTPHHLSLEDRLITSYDPVLKVNPPLRTRADVEALRAALADGTIDAVATDHAPHAPELKDQEWDNAPFGMLGLETAFAVVNTELVRRGVLDPLTAITRFTTGPASVRRLDGHGDAIAPGVAANLTVLDPDHVWTVDGVTLRSKARNTPFGGRELVGRPVHTLLRGRFTLRAMQVQR
jgi:dihydroorotase